MALTISAITKKIGTPTKSNHTLYNTGSSTIYIHTDITKTGFVGNAAELLVLSEIELQAGESVTIDQTLNDVLAVCATGESSTLRKAAGDLRPFEPNPPANSVGVPELTAPMQALLPYVEITSVDNESLTGAKVYFQVKDAAGNNLAGLFFIRFFFDEEEYGSGWGDFWGAGILNDGDVLFDASPSYERPHSDISAGTVVTSPDGSAELELNLEDQSVSEFVIAGVVGQAFSAPVTIS